MSRPMLRRHLRGALVELGWSGRDLTADVRAFQQAYALGEPLAVDGINGPNTREAIRYSLRRHRAGQPDASAYFSYRELACSCGGTLPGCRRILVHRQLLVALDRYRERVGGPVAVVSGYRCPARNRQVGGASSSQHLYGAAADVRAVLSAWTVRRLRLFSGIGRTRWGRVRHVDVRHVSGHNTTGSTPERPSLWTY